MTEQPAKPRYRQLMYLGILFICLGVVFLKTRGLGVTLLLFGAVLAIIGWLKETKVK